MLVISKPGELVVMEEGRPNQVALDLGRRICAEVELGLLGIAVDPKFAENRFVYLYYSRDRGGGCGEPRTRKQPANQVGRFVLPDTNVIDPASEKVIVDNIISAAAHHVAGDLEFGADGYLYITVGDGVCSVRGDAAVRSAQHERPGPGGASGQDPARRSRRQARRHEPVRRQRRRATLHRSRRDPGRDGALQGDLRDGVPQPVPLRAQAGDEHLLRQRRRRADLGGDRPTRPGQELRVEQA